MARSLVLLTALAALSPPVAQAQTAPPPIDYTKPFLYDGLNPRPMTKPTEVLQVLPVTEFPARAIQLQLLDKRDIPAPFQKPQLERETTIRVRPVEPALSPNP
jgi:hypothetical protein